MNNALEVFNGDRNTKQALKEFMLSVIEQEALQRIFKGEDVSHIRDAKLLLDKTFEELDNAFTIKPKPRDTTNQAR